MGTCTLRAPSRALLDTVRIYLCGHRTANEHQSACADYTGRAVEWSPACEHGTSYHPISHMWYSNEGRKGNQKADEYEFCFSPFLCNHQIFKSYAIQTLGSALAFVQDLKLGHYMKVPPRATFAAQAVAMLLSGCLQVGVKTALFTTVPDICSEGQKSMLTCPHNRVFFSASVLWCVLSSLFPVSWRFDKD